MLRGVVFLVFDDGLCDYYYIGMRLWRLMLFLLFKVLGEGVWRLRCYVGNVRVEIVDLYWME